MGSGATPPRGAVGAKARPIMAASRPEGESGEARAARKRHARDDEPQETTRASGDARKWRHAQTTNGATSPSRRSHVAAGRRVQYTRAFGSIYFTSSVIV